MHRHAQACTCMHAYMYTGGSLFSSWKKKSTLPAKENTSPPSGGFDGMPYFTSAVGAYAIGLGATFGANYLTKSGQPALVYIVPSLLLTALATAYSKGELAELFTYRSARAAAAARFEVEMRTLALTRTRTRTLTPTLTPTLTLTLTLTPNP